MFRKVQNIGLLWPKVRMFCLKSTDVFIEEFNQNESFRGQRHHVRVYITNNVLLLFGEMDAPTVGQILKFGTVDADPARPR